MEEKTMDVLFIKKENRKKIMSEKMKNFYINKTLEEKRELTKFATSANIGKKRTEETRKKMSEAYKKYKEENYEEFMKRYKKKSETDLNKTLEEKKEIQNKKSISLRETWDIIKKDKKKLEKRTEKIKEFMKTDKNPMKNSINVIKQIKSLTGRKLSDEHKKAISNSYRGDGTIKSKWYDIKGIKCQGTSEKMFIEKCLLENKIISSHPEAIKTPFGYYRPDFIIDNQLIEIKSSWTYKKFLNEEQFKKIKWINENIIKIDLYIVDSKDDIRLINYTKEINN